MGKGRISGVRRTEDRRFHVATPRSAVPKPPPSSPDTRATSSAGKISTNTPFRSIARAAECGLNKKLSGWDNRLRHGGHGGRKPCDGLIRQAVKVRARLFRSPPSGNAWNTSTGASNNFWATAHSPPISNSTFESDSVRSPASCSKRPAGRATKRWPSTFLTARPNQLAIGRAAPSRNSRHRRAIEAQIGASAFPVRCPQEASSDTFPVISQRPFPRRPIPHNRAPDRRRCEHRRPGSAVLSESRAPGPADQALRALQTSPTHHYSCRGRKPPARGTNLRRPNAG